LAGCLVIDRRLTKARMPPVCECGSKVVEALDDRGPCPEFTAPHLMTEVTMTDQARAEKLYG
jgi:hypothetical protein